MLTYTKLQKRKKEGDRLTGKRDKIKSIDLRFESGQVDSEKEEEGSSRSCACWGISKFWLEKSWQILTIFMTNCLTMRRTEKSR